jgi:hypothetical protein
MDLAPIPDAPSQDHEPVAEGKTWCPDCDALTRFRLEKVEFLGNPVKATFFCMDCGARVFPDAQDGGAARRLRREDRRLRFKAGAALGGMLVLPILAAALVLWLVVRLL